MSCCGNGKIIRFVLNGGVMIDLDIDCDEDWGDINCYMEDGIPHIEIGNDEDGYENVVDGYVNCDDEYFNDKFSQWVTVDKLELIEMIIVRNLYFCECYTMDDLKTDLTSYGIDINNINIPKEWCYGKN